MTDPVSNNNPLNNVTVPLPPGTSTAPVDSGMGKDTFLKSLDCLRPRGLMVGFGNASGAPDPMSPNVLAQKGSLVALQCIVHARAVPVFPENAHQAFDTQ